MSLHPQRPLEALQREMPSSFYSYSTRLGVQGSREDQLPDTHAPETVFPPTTEEKEAQVRNGAHVVVDGKQRWVFSVSS